MGATSMERNREWNLSIILEELPMEDFANSRTIETKTMNRQLPGINAAQRQKAGQKV